MNARRLAILLGITLGVGSSAAYAATLNVGSWHMFAGSQALTKASCTITGAAVDTYADQSNPNTANGASTFIGSRPDAGAKAWSYIRFDLSSCSIPATGGADSATLKLFLVMAPSASRTITLTPVTSTWATSLTWTQAQSLTLGSQTATFTTGTTSNVTKSVAVTIDVDALIKNGTANYGWRLADLGAGTALSAFSSTDSSTNKPQLVINYEK